MFNVNDIDNKLGPFGLSLASGPEVLLSGIAEELIYSLWLEFCEWLDVFTTS